MNRTSATNGAERNTLRLTPNKIGHLAGRLLHLCQQSKQIHVTGSADLVIRTVEDVIFDNMRREEEIDDQVDALIQKHKSEIQTL